MYNSLRLTFWFETKSSVDIIKRLFNPCRATGPRQKPNEETDKPNLEIKENNQLHYSVEFNGRSHLYRNGTAALGIRFRSDLPVNVENVCIAIDGKKFQALDWKPFTFTISSSQLYKFNLSDILQVVDEEKLKAASFIAWAGGKECQSSSFDISTLIL
jgi:hypothetical protein